ncbi:WhiB family transcriptional regulator [Streptomyces kronopolitis]
MDSAACNGAPVAMFFPVGRGGVPAAAEAREAKRFCVRCPVQAECLRHALNFREEYGVWGGLDETERAELIRKARLEAERRRRRERQKKKANAGAAA